MTCPKTITLLAYGVYGCDLPEGHFGDCASEALDGEIMRDTAGWLLSIIGDLPPIQPPSGEMDPP